MNARPKVGTIGEMQFVVGAEHVIDFASDGMPAVLSTPRLVGLIERTARESLQPFLEAHERTVGGELEIRHFAPTPLGQRVTITTRVIHAQDRAVDFHFEVRDAVEVIARGVHRRAVIDVEKFSRRVARKGGG